MEIKAVLLDLDGTLVNTLYSLQDTMNKTMKHFGLDPITMEDTRQYVGNGYKAFVERSVAATADRLYREAEKWERKDEDRAFDLDQQADEAMECFDEACEYYISIFRENCTYRAEPYEGMREALEELRAKGMKLACVTNKSLKEAEKVLDAAYGVGFFDHISADDGKHPLKPDAGVLRAAAEALGVPLSECVMVGDTNTDMQTARNGGIPSIGCIYGFRGRKELEENGASCLVNTAKEIPAAVSGLMASL